MLADPRRLEQVIANLVENAIVHGNGPVTVDAATDASGVVDVSIRDHGPGVPDAVAPTLFSPLRASPVTTITAGGGRVSGWRWCAAWSRPWGAGSGTSRPTAAGPASTSRSRRRAHVPATSVDPADARRGPDMADKQTDVQLFINGEFTDAVSGETFVPTDPATGQEWTRWPRGCEDAIRPSRRRARRSTRDPGRG